MYNGKRLFHFKTSQPSLQGIIKLTAVVGASVGASVNNIASSRLLLPFPFRSSPVIPSVLAAAAAGLAEGRLGGVTRLLPEYVVVGLRVS